MLDSLVDSQSDLDDSFYTVVIAGGSALLLIDKLGRATGDIDAIAVSKELHPYLAQFGINTDMVVYRNCFADDFLHRIQPLDIPSRRIKFFTISLEDLVISKLSSPRPRDDLDIRQPAVVRSLDLCKLQQIADSDDVVLNFLSDRSYQEFLFSYTAYIKYVKEEQSKYENLSKPTSIFT